MQGQQHLQHEEYTLAMESFQEASSLILRTVHPTMPVDPRQVGWSPLPFDVTLVDALVTKTAAILSKATPVQYAFPPAVMSDRSTLSVQAQKLVTPFTETGLQITSFHGGVQTNVTAALDAAERQDWKAAVGFCQAALAQTPDTELTIRGGLLHDMAVLSEKAGDRGPAQEFGQASINTFAQAKVTDAQAQALATTAGIFARAGNTPRA